MINCWRLSLTRMTNISHLSGYLPKQGPKFEPGNFINSIIEVIYEWYFFRLPAPAWVKGFFLGVSIDLCFGIFYCRKSAVKNKMEGKNIFSFAFLLCFSRFLIPGFTTKEPIPGLFYGKHTAVNATSLLNRMGDNLYSFLDTLHC